MMQKVTCKRQRQGRQIGNGLRFMNSGLVVAVT